MILVSLFYYEHGFPDEDTARGVLAVKIGDIDAGRGGLEKSLHDIRDAASPPLTGGRGRVAESEEPQEPVDVHRLHEVLVEARFPTGRAVGRLAVARQRDQKHVLRAPACCAVGAPTSKPSISGSPTSRMATAGRTFSMSARPAAPFSACGALEPCLRQQLAEQLAAVRVVFHDHDPRRPGVDERCGAR